MDECVLSVNYMRISPAIRRALTRLSIPFEIIFFQEERWGPITKLQCRAEESPHFQVLLRGSDRVLL